MTKRGWWAIHAEELMKMLKRCHAGEDPDTVYNEALANGAEIEDVPGDGD